MSSELPRVAIIYQGLPPPIIDGIAKPKKPTAYSDSSADIAFSLRQRGWNVITPVDTRT